MKLTVISHACFLLEHRGFRLLVDPWLEGSVYWGSWWHRERPIIPAGTLEPDAVYLTHRHPDHFHLPSLKKLSARSGGGRPVVFAAKFPIGSVGPAVQKIGFDRVTELAHGQAVRLAEDLTIFSYQSQYEEDSVLVVQADGVCVINLNDAKPSESLWKRLQQKHASPDLVLRSFAPAWSYPECFEFERAEDRIPAGKEEYLESFRTATVRLRPRFAVPFASGVCHLHRETLSLNGTLPSASDVAKFWDRRPAAGTELLVLDPGDSWTPEKGREPGAVLSRTADPVSDISGGSEADWLTRRLAEENERLAVQYARDTAAHADFAAFEGYFGDLFKRTALIRRWVRAAAVWTFAVPAKDGTEAYWTADFASGRVSRSSAAPEGWTSLIRVPGRVLQEALAGKLVGHIDISKRWKVRVRAGGLEPHLAAFVLIGLYESGHLSLRRLVSGRFWSGWLPRLGELQDQARIVRGIRREGLSAISKLMLDPAS